MEKKPKPVQTQTMPIELTPARDEIKIVEQSRLPLYTPSVDNTKALDDLNKETNTILAKI